MYAKRAEEDAQQPCCQLGFRLRVICRLLRLRLIARHLPVCLLVIAELTVLLGIARLRLTVLCLAILRPGLTVLRLTVLGLFILSLPILRNLTVLSTLPILRLSTLFILRLGSLSIRLLLPRVIRRILHVLL